MNTSDFLLENVDNAKVAITMPEQDYSYGELKKAIVQLENELIGFGVKPLDKVAILGSNSFFWIASYLSILRRGGVAVPLSTSLQPNDLITNLLLADCKALCIDRVFRRKFGVLFHLPLITEQNLSGFENININNASKSEYGDQSFDAAFMFTSGSVGKPRIVRVTHRNIQANTSSIINCLDLKDSEKIMVVLPFYYCYGTSLLHTHLRAGGTLVLGGNLMYPEQVLDLVESKKCTGFAGVPSTYQSLLRNTTFKKRKFSHLRKLQQAGGKLHKTLIEEIIGYESGCDLYVMYGQTEATARLSCLPPTLTREKIGSIGNGIQGVKLQVLDDFGNTVLPGQTGEIIATGENISPGYYKDQEATLEKFKNGFLQTGDIATVDSDGYIYIVGRKSDFIKSYGNRVSSQEIESATLEINDIFYAAVIGIPDLERGEAIVLFVTLKHNSTITNQDIIIHLKSRFPMYKVPAKVYVIDGMPFNSNGKIDKTELCKKLEAESNQSE